MSAGKTNKGIVYIVGAGPGDIGLFTIKGLRCLERSECVVYDFHLNAQVLNYISHDAEFVYAGKRGGSHSMSQEQINALLVKRGGEGKVVCRLKGGDPFVFGRGGEEALALSEAGIEFEIVPGISSSVAAPAYAGIPLTHRKYSSSFAVVPGYEDATKTDSSIDWARLATGVGTLVFLMAVKNIAELTEKLIYHGRAADTPVAIVRWGTRADQQTLVGTLGTIAEEVRQREIKPPAVMVVGEVVKLREALRWYDKKPLFGVRILVTREHSRGFEDLEDLGAEVIEFPTVLIAPPKSWDELDASIEGVISGSRVPDWLVFTSANGVEKFFGRYRELGHDIRALAGIKVCAIGEATGRNISAHGINVDLIPDKFNAEGLVKAFTQAGGGGDLKGMRFLLPRAEVAREVFPEAVRAQGGEIDTPVCYRATMPRTHGSNIKRFLMEGRVTVATFTSAATFENFMKIMGDDAEGLLEGVTIAAIGPVTARAVEAAGLAVHIVPERATVDAMLEAIKAKFSKPSS